MVVNATANSTFFVSPVPQDLNPLVPVAQESLQGPYQLEIRRGAEYGGPIGGTTSDILLYDQFDTNDRLIPDSTQPRSVSTPAVRLVGDQNLEAPIRGRS